MNKEFLKNLLGTISPSGYEQDAIRMWANEAKSVAGDVYVDTMGNAHATINPSAKRKVIVVGHIDEIGLIVTRITDKGFLKFSKIGGWDHQVLIGQRVIIKSANGNVTGVIGRKPIHQMEEKDKSKVAELNDLFIDIGAVNKAAAEKLISLGDSVIIDYGFADLAGDNFTARGIDDRIGAFIALEVIRELSKRDIKVAVEAIASVQEEVGLRGIVPAAYLANADVGFAIDVTFASDFPGVDETGSEVKLGHGVGIERGPIANEKLTALLRNIGDSKGIKYQVEARGRPYGTDAEPMQRSRGGVVTTNIGIPTRYLHSPNEVANWNDVKAAIDLLVESIAAMTPDTDFSFV